MNLNFYAQKHSNIIIILKFRITIKIRKNFFIKSFINIKDYFVSFK